MVSQAPRFSPHTQDWPVPVPPQWWPGKKAGPVLVLHTRKYPTATSLTPGLPAGRGVSSTRAHCPTSSISAVRGKVPSCAELTVAISNTTGHRLWVRSQVCSSGRCVLGQVTQLLGDSFLTHKMGMMIKLSHRTIIRINRMTHVKGLSGCLANRKG